MNKQQIADSANLLFQCLQQRQTTEPLKQLYTDITIDDAYQISLRFLALRQQQNKEQVVGKKIGVTSAAVQNILGVFQPDFGFLTDTMHCADENIDTARLIQPRAEAEIAFRLNKTLTGTMNTAEDVLAATDVVIPAFEIVDSRITNWTIGIEDTIADNASCGVYVLGDNEVDPRTLDLPNLNVEVIKNGVLLSEGLGSAVMGNPLNAVAWLANTLGSYGVSLDAGETILSGSMVPLEPVERGDVFTMNIVGLGHCKAVFH